MAFPPFPVIIVIVTPIVIAKTVRVKIFQGINFSKILITVIVIILITLITMGMSKMKMFQGIYISKIIPGGAAAATGISTNNSILAALIMMMGIFLSLAFAYISFYFCQYLVKNETKKKK